MAAAQPGFPGCTAASARLSLLLNPRRGTGYRAGSRIFPGKRLRPSARPEQASALTRRETCGGKPALPWMHPNTTRRGVSRLTGMPSNSDHDRVGSRNPATVRHHAPPETTLHPTHGLSHGRPLRGLGRRPPRADLGADYRVATFQADITIPLGHACMGGGVADAKEIGDPLWAKGFVLLGPDPPVVVVALDWCQCNNDSYDRWRDALARTASTTRQRVMLATVHQHDAPIFDLTAQRLLDAQGMVGARLRPGLSRARSAKNRGGADQVAGCGAPRNPLRHRPGQGKPARLEPPRDYGPGSHPLEPR